MNLGFIIQARMGSTRLPKKILLPFFKDKCILELLVQKLKEAFDFPIIIATSTESNNDVIEKFCDLHQIKCFRGSENDVLKRFIDAAEAANINKLVRICSDNPFLELDSIKMLVDKAKNSGADYISFNINGSPSIKTHYGFWTEYATLSALKKVQQMTGESLYHEHVTNFIYSHPADFKIEWIEGPDCLKGRNDIRLTCDTIEDFQNSSSIYADLCKNNPYPTIKDIVDYLGQHSEYEQKMVEQIKLNSK